MSPDRRKTAEAVSACMPPQLDRIEQGNTSAIATASAAASTASAAADAAAAAARALYQNAERLVGDRDTEHLIPTPLRNAILEQRGGWRGTAPDERYQSVIGTGVA
eukprot:2292246-Prymnesium_polylepis.1